MPEPWESPGATVISVIEMFQIKIINAEMQFLRMRRHLKIQEEFKEESVEGLKRWPHRLPEWAYRWFPVICWVVTPTRPWGAHTGTAHPVFSSVRSFVGTVELTPAPRQAAKSYLKSSPSTYQENAQNQGAPGWCPDGGTGSRPFPTLASQKLAHCLLQLQVIGEWPRAIAPDTQPTSQWAQRRACIC